MSTEPAEPAPIAARALFVPTPGIAVFGLAAAGPVVEIVAIVVGSGGMWPLATALGWVAIVITALAAIGGVIAAILHRGRAWAIAAVVLAVVANPLVQIAVLGLLGARN